MRAQRERWLLWFVRHMAPIVLVACFPPVVITEVSAARARAAIELDCHEPSQIHAVIRDDLGPHVVDVNACGRTARYNCPRFVTNSGGTGIFPVGTVMIPYSTPDEKETVCIREHTDPGAFSKIQEPRAIRVKMEAGDVLQIDGDDRITGIAHMNGTSTRFVPGTAKSPADARWVEGVRQPERKRFSYRPGDEVLRDNQDRIIAFRQRAPSKLVRFSAGSAVWSMNAAYVEGDVIDEQ